MNSIRHCRAQMKDGGREGEQRRLGIIGLLFAAEIKSEVYSIHSVGRAVARSAGRATSTAAVNHNTLTAARLACSVAVARPGSHSVSVPINKERVRIMRPL